jgi:hypothetical protein
LLSEKDALLVTGLAVTRHITVDDSGARHQGHNGYVTQIGNDWFEWFSWFASIGQCAAGSRSATAPRLHFAEAWRPESRDPNPEPGRKQASGIVRRVTRRVLSRRDVLRDWLRYKAKERT